MGACHHLINVVKWATEIGHSTIRVVSFILERYEVEKTLNSIFTLKKLERAYTVYEIEQACKRVMEATNGPTAKSVQTMIKTIRKEDERKASEINSKTTHEKYGFTRALLTMGGNNR